MSQSLDSIGWTKKFVDVRQQIPRVSLPTSLLRRGNATTSAGNNGSESESDSDDNNTTPPPPLSIHSLRTKGVASSRDVAAALTAPLFDEKLHFPLGHNMMVAMSRSRLSAYMHKAGRPVVESVARELVDSIFSWSDGDDDDDDDDNKNDVSTTAVRREKVP